MNDEWVELTEASGRGTIVKRDTIISLYENADPKEATFRYARCVMQTTKDPELLLAGEYDIVRDEITGGKWSMARHKHQQAMVRNTEVNQLAYSIYAKGLAPSDMEPK